MLAQTTTAATSSPSAWIIVAIVVLAVIVVAALFARRRRSAQLRQRYGPEYERTVAATGSAERAEADLTAREKRRRSLDIRALTPGARDRYADEWRAVQARFVDTPVEAIRQANRLVESVMRDRGYPLENFEQEAADISVDHPGVVSNYRTAHDIALRTERGEASTEDLRQAMIHFRSLFEELLGANAAARRS